MQKCTQHLSIIQVGLKAYWQNVCQFHRALKKLTKRKLRQGNKQQEALWLKNNVTLTICEHMIYSNFCVMGQVPNKKE